LFLARALEEKGEIKDACASYRVVLQRWGKARPKSVSADLARKRVEALKCAP
jgi:serine/threonine-protein kinase